MAYQGQFKPKNPEKYRGNPTQIIYRSSWELVFMRYLDEHRDVLEWQSEEFSIPYRSPLDGKIHRYFPDFRVKFKTTDGSIKTKVIEIKPSTQSKPPEKKRGKATKRYITEVKTWAVNSQKWEAAMAFCMDRGWEFQVMTENELGIK